MPQKYSEDVKQNIIKLYEEEHRSKVSLSREYGIHQTTIGKWIKDKDSILLSDGSTVSVSEFKRLKKELKDLKEENEILKAGGGITGKALGRIQAIKFITEKSRKYRLKIILKALRLSKTTYYNWLNYKPSNRSIEDSNLKDIIYGIWKENYRAYGYIRITIALKRLGIHIGTSRVYRLMKELKIRSLMGRRFKKPGTHVDYDQRQNLIKSCLNTDIWRADITYIELKPGAWIYLSTILDERSKKIISFNLGKQMTTNLIVITLLNALKKEKKPKYLHSDMGSQYTSGVFENILTNNKIKHSYSKQGYPYDNGTIEAFHSLLKREFIFQTRFDNYSDLVIRINNYINWFNSERIRTAV
ncbi:IS3 family transposase [Fructilactobacillus vespulae]|uniref:IS3 family transposase n=1 Tax=Fructilactobacillus vespulae TaxID=1249630 RepID=UPI0039B65397